MNAEIACTTFECYLEQFRNNQRTTASFDSTTALIPIDFDSDEGDEMKPPTSAFRILFPILLIVGIFMLIAISVVLHRIVLKLVRKRWSSTLSRQRNTEESETSRRVNTVSQYTDNPPSYNQVLANIEEDSLPTYYQVMNGIVNLGFVNEVHVMQSSQSHDQTSTSNSADHLQQPTESVSSENIDESVPPPMYNTNERPTPENIVTNVNPTTNDIEDIIDSIAVPSRVSELVSRHSCTTLRGNLNKEQSRLPTTSSTLQSTSCCATSTVRNQSLLKATPILTLPRLFSYDRTVESESTPV
ncbi:glutathione peroxidase_like protein c isoform X1 [Ciona intestinalis]